MLNFIFRLTMEQLVTCKHCAYNNTVETHVKKYIKAIHLAKTKLQKRNISILAINMNLKHISCILRLIIKHIKLELEE